VKGLPKAKSLNGCKPGDTINEDDTLLEVQNDKSVEEIPSPVTGTVKISLYQKEQLPMWVTC